MTPYTQLEPKVNEFPRRRFLGLAGFQVAVGLLFIVLACADLGVSIQEYKDCRRAIERQELERMEERATERREIERMDERFEGYRPTMVNDVFDRPQCDVEQDFYFAFTAGTPIIFGIMFIIAGALGVGSARTSLTHRRSGLKIGFMVLCVINILVFIPMTLVHGGSWIILSTNWTQIYNGNTVFRIVAGGIYFALSLVLFIVAIVSAGVACCCAPVEEVKVVYVPQYFKVQPPNVTTTKTLDVGDLPDKVHII